MSELKVHKIGDLCFDFKMGKDVGIDFYLKSEADKVLADLEESHKKEVGQLLIEIAGLKADYKEACDRLQTANLIKDEQLSETRHSKRKLCLAKSQEWRNYAAFCGMQSSCHNHRGFGKTAEKYSWKEYHAWKCVHRYKELAEKFKETK